MLVMTDANPTEFQGSSGVFVYGTLQRAEKRGRMWPHEPLCIESATVQGRLYDFGEYPGLVDGSDPIVGELWSFEPKHMARVLEVLDEIETFNQENRIDRYVRRLVPVTLGDGKTHQAHAYFFARPDELLNAIAVPRGEQGFVQWRRLAL